MFILVFVESLLCLFKKCDQLRQHPTYLSVCFKTVILNAFSVQVVHATIIVVVITNHHTIDHTLT